ncbi:hypothetical protein B0H10DRAFT_2184867, partial [Mycena sp. CBHHK59/15]
MKHVPRVCVQAPSMGYARPSHKRVLDPPGAVPILGPELSNPRLPGVTRDVVQYHAPARSARRPSLSRFMRHPSCGRRPLRQIGRRPPNPGSPLVSCTTAPRTA